jgi:hypothetical protein
MDCMNSCHDHGFTVAGTLWTSSAGTTPDPGAYVTVIDASSNKLNIVVDTNGNFYTSTSVTFPLTVYASECPMVTAMTAQVTAESGSVVGCNQTSCHGSGGNPGPMYLQ